MALACYSQESLVFSYRWSGVAQLFSLGVTVFACIDMFQPIATLVVGLGVILFAFLQWKTAHDKLRLDLFDRRYKAYKAMINFLGVILRRATFDDSDLFEFYAGMDGSDFLFGTDIADYYKQVRTRAIDMRLQHTLWQSKQGDERTRMIEAEHKHLMWLTEQLTGATKVFAPYLSYADVKGNALEDFISKHQ